ncbi:MAG: hypothetical protein IJJ33_07160 [Victivallales bacterium]|nr:hypothetical protein [Victivallales bacterium]
MRFFAWILFCLSLATHAAPWVAMFGSWDCTECAAFKKEWQKRYSPGQGPVLVFLPIEHNRNYALLNRLEEELKTAAQSSSFPIFVAGDRVIGGHESISALPERDLLALAAQPCPSRFARQINEAADAAQSILVTLMATGQKRPTVESPPATGTSVPATPALPANLRLAFFSQVSCAKCSRQEKELQLLAEDVPGLAIDRYDVGTTEGRAMLARFHEAFSVPRTNTNLAPMVCWADGYVTGQLATAAQLQEALAKPATRPPFWAKALTPQELEAQRDRQKRVLDSLLLSEVLSAGLADGINPCAFATSIFLISYLLMLRKKRREIALVGFSFCAGVFIAYFLFGLGFSYLLKYLSRFSWVQIALYGLFALLSAVFAVGSVRDAIRFRRSGKAEDLTLGLSLETHQRIHSKIRMFTQVGPWLLGPAALLLGAIVSGMELVCTGQILLPTLTAINADGVTNRSLFLLLLYNLCFILPLAAITILACCGVGAKALGIWARRHIFATKLVMAAIFTAITAIMLYLLLSLRNQ